MLRIIVTINLLAGFFSSWIPASANDKPTLTYFWQFSHVHGSCSEYPKYNLQKILEGYPLTIFFEGIYGMPKTSHNVFLHEHRAEKFSFLKMDFGNLSQNIFYEKIEDFSKEQKISLYTSGQVVGLENDLVEMKRYVEYLLEQSENFEDHLIEYSLGDRVIKNSKDMLMNYLENTTQAEFFFQKQKINKTDFINYIKSYRLVYIFNEDDEEEKSTDKKNSVKKINVFPFTPISTDSSNNFSQEFVNSVLKKLEIFLREKLLEMNTAIKDKLYDFPVEKEILEQARRNSLRAIYYNRYLSVDPRYQLVDEDFLNVVVAPRDLFFFQAIKEKASEIISRGDDVIINAGVAHLVGFEKYINMLFPGYKVQHQSCELFRIQPGKVENTIDINILNIFTKKFPKVRGAQFPIQVTINDKDLGKEFKYTIKKNIKQCRYNCLFKVPFDFELGSEYSIHIKSKNNLFFEKTIAID